MDNLIYEEIKKYINDILIYYNILTQPIIKHIESDDQYKIIEISTSELLHDIIQKNRDMIKSYITQIFDSILINFDHTLNYLDIKFNDSNIWIIYSYINSSTKALDLNHISMYNFMLYTSGDLYIKNHGGNITDLWIVRERADDEYYDEFGCLEYPLSHGRIIESESLEDLIDYVDIETIKETIKNYKKHQKELRDGKLKEIIKNEKIKIIKELQGRDDLIIILYKGDIKLLKIIDSTNSECISEEIHKYILFSILNITPKVFKFNILIQGPPYTGTMMYGYLITDYIPLTLYNIKNKKDQKEAIEQAIIISKMIEETDTTVLIIMVVTIYGIR